MLESGLIQHKKSHFASFVILVRKKDSTYRFCVDYCHLNAITAKTKFPVPIMDEFLDELYGMAWFSTLTEPGTIKFVWHPKISTKLYFRLITINLSFE